MNRLTFKQRGSISAFSASTIRAGAGTSRDERPGVELACEPAVLNSRKAFTSDRALNVVRKSGHIRVVKRGDARPRLLLNEQGVMMHLTVDSCDVTDLRRRVAAACSNLMLFMRIQPLQHASKMRVWILLQRQDLDAVTRAIKSGMPEAELAEVD